MAQKYRETDYMYASARIRALESGIADADRLSHLCEAASARDVLSMLSEYGFEAETSSSREEILCSVLRKGYAEIDAMGGRDAVAFLRYPYDCNNIKALIKCARRGSSTEGMLFAELGTVALSEVRRAFEDKRYEVFPPHMAEAIPKAEREFSESGNPQRVDLLLDRACFADMLATATASGMSLAVEWMRARIDLLNLISVVRLIRMRLRSVGEVFLSETLIPGGSLDRDFLMEALKDGSETALAERLEFTAYSFLCPLLNGEASLGEMERAADDARMEIARKAKYLPFGAELMIGYAVALEYEVMNIRILLAGKDAGLSAEVIRERLRKSYV